MLVMVKIKELPILDRPIERMVHYGVSSLTNEELLAILLKTGSKEKSAKELASQILSQANSIENLKSYTLEKYQSIKQCADNAGESVNGYIKKAITSRIKADTGEDISL